MFFKLIFHFLPGMRKNKKRERKVANFCFFFPPKFIIARIERVALTIAIVHT